MADYSHECRKGKLLISIADTAHGTRQCSPTHFKFIHVSDKDDLVREYAASYTHAQLYDICPVFAALDELYGTLSKLPKVSVYESHVSVRWIYRGINVAYKIKLKLIPINRDDIIDDASDLMDRVMSAEAESARLRIKLNVITDQLKIALDVLSKMNSRVAVIESRDVQT